jgi:hypothetical protein
MACIVKKRCDRWSYTPLIHNAAHQSGTKALRKVLPCRKISYHIASNKMASAVAVEVDSRLPYRVGCPILPVLPVETTFSTRSRDSYIPNFSACLEEIGGLLAKYNIPGHGIFFAHRLNYGAVADCPPTLVILSTYDDDSQSNWVKVVEEIYKSLARRGVHQTIELIDEQVFYGPLRTSPVYLRTVPLLKAGIKLSKTVLLLLSIKTGWQLMYYTENFRRARRRNRRLS